jgi:cysteine desulfurase/selenocysteine lyase
MLNPQTIKRDFPILSRIINGKSLTYLDNASTSQKPRQVIDAITYYYSNTNANIHRGVYKMAEEATLAYEGTREEVRTFVNAQSMKEIIFTRNTTESINLIARTWGEANIREGDTIMVSALEHHSNLVPWQELCAKTGATLKVIPLSNNPQTPYTLDLEWFEKNIDNSLRLLALTQASNTTGTIVPIKKFIEIAHSHSAVTVIDAAQSAPHMPIDVQNINADFIAFSGHKMLGPTGVGILYGKQELLEEMPPFLYGGDMIREVLQYKSSWNELPWKFEAGTPNIADVIALREAIRYLKKIGMEDILKHDQQLTRYAKQKLAHFQNLKIHAPNDTTQGAGIVSFEIPFIHPHDIAEIFDSEGVAIRGGHHCAQPLMEHMKTQSTARMSFYLYNSEDDIDCAMAALEKVIHTFNQKK